MRTTAADQTMVEVPLDNGTSWTGTEAQLRREHPTWVKHARIVQTPTRTTRQDYDAEDNGEYDDPHPGRLPSSARRYNQPTWQQGNTRYEMRPGVVQTKIPPRRSAQQQPQETEDLPAARTRRPPRFHWSVYAGIGAMVALLLWAGAAWVSAKWADTQNDWTYTSTFRTFSIDQAVGHDGDSQAHPSHFIAQNDDRRIIIIEFPDNDTSKALIYAGPVLLGDGQDRTPVTLSFQVNPQTNRLDMVLHVEGQSYVFANNGTKFLEPSV